MASYTWNLNLKKPALDDDALITDINNNMDILDAAVNGIQDGLAIVANGNTHVAITSGQFVYVRNHGTLTEGLYVASSNIAANATLSTSNLTADAAGGLNSLNSKLTTAYPSMGISGLMAVKYGNVLMLSNNDTAPQTASAEETLWTLPEGFRPVVKQDFLDSYSKKRIQIYTNGKISCSEALNGAYIRWCIMYIFQ